MRASITVTGAPNATKMQRVFNRAVLGISKIAVQAAKPTLDAAAQAPSGVARPIQWTSDKQRKAFFATNGFGNGIPYRRTGLVNRSWELLAVERGDGQVEIVLLNTAAYASFVYGTFNNNDRYQQGFHRNSGWQRARTIRAQTTAAVRKEIRVLFTDTLKAFGRLDI